MIKLSPEGKRLLDEGEEPGDSVLASSGLSAIMQPMQQPDIRPVMAPWWKPVCYVLEEQYTVTWFDADDAERQVTVPTGFQYDGSSEWVMLLVGIIPSFVLWLIGYGQDGLHRAASVVHDYLYVEQPEGWTRAEMDELWYDLAIEAGMRTWRARLRWLFIRAFGWTIY